MDEHQIEMHYFQIAEQAAQYRSTEPALARWAAGYGVIQHTDLTQVRIHDMATQLARYGTRGDGVALYDLLTALDRLTSAGMWLVVHETYARHVYLDGRPLTAADFKPRPEGHTGGALNMVPAYTGYLAVNALTGHTRSWLMGQGHCVAAIDSVNLLVGNMTPAHAARYALTEEGLTRYVRDFYAYRLGDNGRQASPLGSHVNAHTAGGLAEGGYLGFAELQYVHMPLPGERLVAFLSDGAFEEQRGVDGAVITALNEEAVAAAALANKGGINLLHTYEAFGTKMHGAVRQEIIFANHCAEAGRPQRWLSIPLVLTSHTWENGKNEQSHQDPSMAEALLGEPCHVSRVVFPADFNTAATTIDMVYQTQGQIWTLVAPKAATLPNLFTPEEARRLVPEGGLCLDWASHAPMQAQVILVAVGAYQLGEVLAASQWLTRRDIPHTTVYLLEPGRFRVPRSEAEQVHQAAASVREVLFPPQVPCRLLVTHTRPEAILGLLGVLHTGAQTSGLGYINQGGTLDTSGMLFVNRCSWAHCLAEVARLLALPREHLLSAGELQALDGVTSPHGVIIPEIAGEGDQP